LSAPLARDLSQGIDRALWPFMLLQITGMLVVMAFPEIALWLPAS